MRPLTVVLERQPMVSVLIGLLFNATGLYLGSEYSLSFAYMIIGWFCTIYGFALFFYRLRERPEAPEATRISPSFISYGSTVVMTDGKTIGEQDAAENSGAQ